MRRIVVTLAFLALVVLGSSFAFSQRDGERRGQGVFAYMVRGQAVNLKDADGRYEIELYANGPETLGYRVVEVQPDYVVIGDVGQVTEIRIPIYSIKAVKAYGAGKIPPKK